MDPTTPAAVREGDAGRRHDDVHVGHAVVASSVGHRVREGVRADEVGVGDVDEAVYAAVAVALRRHHLRQNTVLRRRERRDQRLWQATRSTTFLAPA